MTRRNLFRLVVAIKMGIAGHASAFYWMLPRKMKLPLDQFYWLSRSVLKSIATYRGSLPDDLFYSTRLPLLQMLRSKSVPCDGGMYIQSPLIYGGKVA